MTKDIRKIMLPGIILGSVAGFGFQLDNAGYSFGEFILAFGFIISIMLSFIFAASSRKTFEEQIEFIFGCIIIGGFASIPAAALGLFIGFIIT